MSFAGTTTWRQMKLELMRWGNEIRRKMGEGHGIRNKSWSTTFIRHKILLIFSPVNLDSLGRVLSKGGVRKLISPYILFHQLVSRVLA